MSKYSEIEDFCPLIKEACVGKNCRFYGGIYDDVCAITAIEMFAQSTDENIEKMKDIIKNEVQSALSSIESAIP